MNFYRVANNKTKQGLWYSFDGKHTGLIHNKFSFCKNKDLPMPYDEKIAGYLSATKTLDELFAWFTKEDIATLETYGYYIFEYKSNDFFFHNNHWVISQKTSTIKKRIKLETLTLELA